MGDQIHISDLAVPAGVTLQHEAEELVVQISIPRGLEDEAGEGEEGEAGEGGDTADTSSDGGDSGDGGSGA